VSKLQQALKDLKREARRERQALVDSYSQEIHQLQDALAEKANEIKESMFITREHFNKWNKSSLNKSNLDETTRSVYKENVCINAALEFHVKEGHELKKERDNLFEQNKELLSEKELNGMIVQEKWLNLNNNTNVLQSQTLNSIVVLYNDYYLNEQRTEVEQFFLDSLEYVKNEIVRNRVQYRRDAQAAYQQRMLDAHAGHGEYPMVRTFKPSDTSTNNVFEDLKVPERWTGMEGKIDIGDLTWEQRERILRLMFAKMNGFKEKRRHKLPSLDPTPTSKQPPVNEEGDSTFITQGAVLPPESASQVKPALPSLPAPDHTQEAVA
ncbi:hypothetical protein QZH41_019378, partial [Actinostola sp. cb2023]